MSWKITNTMHDRTKVALHRSAPKLVMEPLIGSLRLRLNSSMVIDDEHFERIKDFLDQHKAKGVLDYEQVGAPKAAPAKKEEPKAEEPKAEEKSNQEPGAGAAEGDAKPIKLEELAEMVESKSEAPAEPSTEGSPKKGKKKSF